jgi:hydrogenase maturation protein HypF
VAGRSAQRFLLGGRVQGLGVRPAVYRLATELGLAGNVENTPHGVTIFVEGSEEAVAEFAVRVVAELPPGAQVRALAAEAASPAGAGDFQIIRRPGDAELSAHVPPDIAVCRDCLAEVFEGSDRRWRYPFTSCTRCGPRYTILRAMPYERADTAMSEFALCPSCQSEYDRPSDRRFHAQTNACASCGPRVFDDVDLSNVRQALRSGQIVALRGLGGYQLLADATNDSTVACLRERKGRRSKPLAVMVPSLEAAESLATLTSEERAALVDPINPIVLVRAKPDPNLAPSIHPGLDTVGLMLPTTPLHALLLRDVGRPLVCTSGNRDGEPLEFEIEAAASRLGGVCNLFLHHNRPIERPIDDSVVRIISGRRVTLRLARGLAPLPLDLSQIQRKRGELPRALALGGYLKSAAAWSNGSQAVLGPHVGDQETVASRERFLAQCDDWKRLYRFEPTLLVHDMHPEYYTSRWAAEQDLETMAVQHHHAHVVSGMIEHGWLDREVLGVAWDGTGFGDDGSIWGGEFLLTRAGSYRPITSLRPFRLPGGEAAIREPWRVAVSLATALEERAVDTEQLAAILTIECRQIERVRQACANARLSPRTTSAGRLFDAIAAIVLRVTHAQFDGQPAMLLEAAADRNAAGQYELPLQNYDADSARSMELDWRPLVAGVLADTIRGLSPSNIAMRVHRALAAGIVAVWRQRPDLPLVLSGGVFQNRLLTETIVEMFPGDSRGLGLPGLIPPNDGGLAAGQLAIAIARSMR